MHFPVWGAVIWWNLTLDLKKGRSILDHIITNYAENKIEHGVELNLAAQPQLRTSSPISQTHALQKSKF